MRDEVNPRVAAKAARSSYSAVVAKVALPVVIAMYLPLFGRTVPAISAALPQNLVNWCTVFLAVFTGAQLLMAGGLGRVDPVLRRVLWFNLVFAGVLTLKAVPTGAFREAANLAAGVNTSTLLILLVTRQREFGRDARLFQGMTAALATMVVLQVVLSAVESRRGEVFGEYIVNIYGGLADRDVLSLIGASQAEHFGFSIPFTGMIGQHNPFGIMLLFYVLYVLVHYSATSSRLLLWLLPIIGFGLMGNGTRSALALSVLVVALFFLFRIRNSPVGATALGFAVVLAIGIIAEPIYRRTAEYYAQSETMSTRLMLWDGVITLYANLDNIPRFLFGLPVEEINYATEAIVGAPVSVESEYARVFLSTGIVGLVLYVWPFAVLLGPRVRRDFQETRSSLVLLSLSTLLISSVMTGVIFYAVYGLLTLTLLNAVHARCLRHCREPLRPLRPLVGSRARTLIN